jgi:hypothetical protein
MRGNWEKAYGNSLYYLCNFSLNLKLYQSKKRINKKRKKKKKEQGNKVDPACNLTLSFYQHIPFTCLRPCCLAFTCKIRRAAACRVSGPVSLLERPNAPGLGFIPMAQTKGCVLGTQ